MKDAELSISQAAPLMGLSRRQARRVLVEIDRAHPELNLLRRPAFGAFKGNYRVSAKALRRIILDDEGILMQQAMTRIGLLESDMEQARMQIAALRKELRQQKTPQCSVPASG